MEQKHIIEENIRYKRPMLYFSEYGARQTFKPFPDVAWHWHEDFEISRVKCGSVIYKSLMREVVLEPGDAIFINSKAIHSVTPIEPRENVHHISQFFNNVFIAGYEGSLIDTKYIIPFQRRTDIDVVVMKKNDEYFARVHELLDENSKLLRTAPKYYEFKLKQNVFEIWQIVNDYVKDSSEDNSIPRVSNSRLRHIITYLQKNYNKKISLEELCRLVHVSPRECNRMFNKYLKISPIGYQKNIRLQKAAAMLADFDKSIGEIALETGYSSNSYFTAAFKERYKMTPKEYRKMIEINNRENGIV